MRGQSRLLATYAFYRAREFLFDFNRDSVSILHHFRVIIAYFPKFKDIT